MACSYGGPSGEEMDIHFEVGISLTLLVKLNICYVIVEGNL